jgi:type II secretory pathway pseudopilin PulG
MAKRQPGVTLIETLVFLVILAILLGLLLPAAHYARESARRASCAGNLHQLATAYEQFAALRKNWNRGRPDNTIGGWAILILPFLEDANLADSLSGDPPLDPDNPPEAARKRPWVMTCPSGFEGDRDVKSVPASHYTFLGRYSQWLARSLGI